MAQLMPLPLTVSCFSKIQIGFAFLVPAHLGSPRQRAVKRACVCVCVLHGRRSAANAGSATLLADVHVRSWTQFSWERTELWAVLNNNRRFYVWTARCEE